MTVAAVESGLYHVVDDIVDAVREEFDALRALRQGRPSGPAGVVVDRLVKRNELVDRYVVRLEVERYRSDARRQVSAMYEAAANEEPIETYWEALLDADVYYTELDPGASEETREAVAAAVASRATGRRPRPSRRYSRPPRTTSSPRSRTRSRARKRSNWCGRTSRFPNG